MYLNPILSSVSYVCRTRKRIVENSISKWSFLIGKSWLIYFYLCLGVSKQNQCVMGIWSTTELFQICAYIEIAYCRVECCRYFSSSPNFSDNERPKSSWKNMDISLFFLRLLLQFWFQTVTLAPLSPISHFSTFAGFSLEFRLTVEPSSGLINKF